MSATVTPISAFSRGADRQRTTVSSETRESRETETAQIFERIATTKSEDERAELRARAAALNVSLAHALASRYRDRGESDADLRQVACLGLMKAVHRFDSSRGVCFASYAIPTILGELKRHFRDHCWTVRPTRELQELQATIASASAELAQRTGREPSIKQLAAHLHVEPKLVEEAMIARHGYLSKSIDTESTSPSWLAGDDSDMVAVEDHAALAPAIRKLGGRDREVIRLRFFEDKTQAEISDVVGVSQMQVSRILRRIFETLRTELAV